LAFGLTFGLTVLSSCKRYSGQAAFLSLTKSIWAILLCLAKQRDSETDIALWFGGMFRCCVQRDSETDIGLWFGGMWDSVL